MSYGTTHTPSAQRYTDGGAQGGGFFASSQGRVDSPSGGGGGQKKSNSQTIRAVTIKQLEEATQPHPDADFQLFGQDIHQVTFVARVFSIAEQSTYVVYVVEDGTGTIDCRLWLDAAKDSDFQAQKRAAIREGTYVRVIGHMRSFGNQRKLQAFHVRPVTDHNEITYHTLQALYEYLKATKGVVGKSGMAVPGTSAFGNYMPAHAGMAGQQHQQSDYSMPQGNAHGGAAYGSGGDFNQIQNRILQMVRQLGQSNEGVNIPFLCQTLAPEGLNEMTIRENIEWLIGEGHLYSTIDDDHCKTIE